MKAVKVISIGLLFAVVLFLSVYALFPEETAEPVVGYITPSSSAVSNDDSSEAHGSFANGSSRTSISAIPFRPPKNPSFSSEKSSFESGIVPWLNINTATEEEFCLLDGITEELAERIIVFRKLAGGFTSIDDLNTVPLLTRDIFDQIKDNVYCE